MPNIIGIDPGAKGCICLASDKGGALFHDIAGNIPAAINKIRCWNESYEVTGVVIEGITSMFGYSAKSSASLIGSAKLLEGACIALGIPIIDKPRPTDWKKAVGLVLNPPKAPKKPGKDSTSVELTAYEEALKLHRQAKARYKRGMDTKSCVRAIELFPKAAPMLMQAKDVDRAESLLLGYWGLLKLSALSGRGGVEGERISEEGTI